MLANPTGIRIWITETESGTILIHYVNDMIIANTGNHYKAMSVV